MMNKYGLYQNETLFAGILGAGKPYTNEKLTKSLLTTRIALERQRKRANDAEEHLRDIRHLVMRGWR